MNKKNFAVFISGRGSNLAAIIEAVKNKTITGNLAFVMSDQPNAKGLEIAQRENIPTYTIVKIEGEDKSSYEARIMELLQKHDIELIVLAGFMRILSSDFVAQYKYKILNIHPSILPSFPGINVHQQAIDYGVKYSGCTVHYVDEGMDTGPIIAQQVVDVDQQDNAETLAAKILKLEHQLYPQVVSKALKNEYMVVGRKVIDLSKERKDD